MSELAALAGVSRRALGIRRMANGRKRRKITREDHTDYTTRNTNAASQICPLGSDHAFDVKALFPCLYFLRH
jgi:hypothetical protein